MLVELAINVLASVILVAGGYFGGMYRERQAAKGIGLDENILSKDEYQKALAGKRHFRDY